MILLSITERQADTRSKGEVERASKKKGRAEFFPSLQPIQVEISMLGTDPNIPVERKYLSLGLETCPNLRCHNKKRGVEDQTQQKKKGKKD